jgi:1,4-alpha-glucan branching enzyme
MSRAHRTRASRHAPALRYAAALLVATLGALVLGRHLMPASDPQAVVVEFRLEAPHARQVAVVGDWNGWNPELHRLSDRGGDGVWRTTVTLRRGREYQYQFLVDGTAWIPDPSTPLRVDDGFGGTNSVLDI